MRPLPLVVLGLSLALAGAASLAAEPGAVQLRHGVLDLRETRSRVRLSGRLDRSTALPASVLSDPVRVTVGGVDVFTFEPDAVPVPFAGAPSRMRYRMPGVPARFTLRPESGRFELSGRAVDLTALAGASPTDVAITVTLGGEEFTCETNFAARGSRWRAMPVSHVLHNPIRSGGSDSDGDVAFEDAGSGWMSRIAAEETVVIRDDAAWTALWARHAEVEAPAVDFAERMIVGLFLGDRPTSGYAASIASVTAAGGGYEVATVEVEPASDRILLTVITQPWALVSVPRADGDVTFTKTTAISRDGDE